MKKIQLEKQVTEPIDDETMTALEEAEAEYERGEGISLEEAQILLRKRMEEWREAHK